MAKFCVPYVADSQSRFAADMIQIEVTDENVKELRGFIENNNPNQTIVVGYYFSEQENEALFIDTIAKTKDKNVLYRLEPFFVNQLKDVGIELPRYLCEWICDSWEDYYDILNNYDVSDVMIMGELLFDLDRVKTVADSHNVTLHANCNGYVKEYADKPYLSGFIRPEDIPFYEPYIDVFHIDAEYNCGATRMDTLFDIYTKDKKWDGQLSLIIANVKANIEGSRLMSNHWAKHRVNCRRDCMKGYPCTICKSQLEIAQALKDMNIVFVKEEQE